VLRIGLVSLAISAVLGRPALAGAIHQAAMVGNIERVRAILRASPRLVDDRDEGGMTALHWAVRGDDAATTQLLIAAGADVNVTDRLKRTPLGVAAYSNRIDAVRLLLARGADVNAVDNSGVNALYGAAYGEGRKPLVELLIARGAKVVQVNNQGESPLVGAVLYGDLETVNVLARYPFDFKAANTRSGRTLMHTAVVGSSPSAKKNRDAMIARLLALGVPRDAKDIDGLTPADLADRVGSPVLAARLRAAEPEPGAKSSPKTKSKSKSRR
jgi:uncharacterized protein